MTCVRAARVVRFERAADFSVEFDEPQPWRPYEVRVRSRNKLGESLVDPQTIDGRTGEAVPEMRPENFRVENVGATSATFSWEPIDESQIQANFSGYRVTFWYDDEDLVSTAHTPADVPTLEPAAAAASASTMRRLVRAAADAVELADRRRRARRDAAAAADSERTRSIVVAPGSNRVTVHELKADAQNYATIQVLTSQHEGLSSVDLRLRSPIAACNGKNANSLRQSRIRSARSSCRKSLPLVLAGPRSDILTFRTREGVPTPVRGLAAYPLNGRQQTERGVVVLRWERPRAANGQITHYAVESCRTHGANDEQTACGEVTNLCLPA